MKIQTAIEEKINASLTPLYLEVLNESSNHNVPPGSESHFKVTVVSNEFDGKMLIARHRIINKLLAEELAGAIHALSIHSFTPDEWAEKNQQSPQSPPCLGGAKREQPN
ncbi:MAG: BolA/IbaG family iron-sulfur metabolism protein [Gammaproteobacteria bacterium]|nr:BolA/IbaG family iron-sulfur metabolism protein [Gammaproteobacteria bacterium]